ncbi:MAG: hypothetical protein IKE46_00835 [Selenomonadaceae bacterium]|nr:hypothetical protein [Selenomonadaceae bacterium]
MGKMFESTPKYRKGLIGEEIIRDFLEFHGCTVSRPKDTAPSGSSRVDFVLNAPKKFSLWKGTELVEVKVMTTMGYSYGRFPVYNFPINLIEDYRRYAAEKNLHLNFFVVDEEREQIFWRDIDELEIPLRVEERTFPVDVEHKSGIFHYYHVKQFVPVGRPNFADLERLRSINLSHVDKKILRPLKDDDELSDEEIISESRDAVKNFLDLTLPDDLPTSDEKIPLFVDAMRSSLRRIPTYRFREIYHAVRNLNAADAMPVFAEKFYALLDTVKRERQRASYQTPYIFKPKTSAKKFAELHAPDDTTVEIFALEGDESKLFAEMFHLAEAFGCDTRGLIHSDFGNAVKATSRFYTLNFGSTDKKISAVPVKDVPAILRDYAFNRTDYAEKFCAAKKFSSWWKNAVTTL